jgi:hypothetical protein
VRRPCVRHHPDDEGISLVEIAFSLLLVSLLVGMMAVVSNTFYRVDAENSSSNAELNQLLPVGTSLQRLLRTAVSPATGGSGNAPVPPFGTYRPTHAITPATQISRTALTFYSNTGTPNGPVKVVATLAGSVFTVSTTAPTKGTCPGLHTRPASDRCQWSGKPKLMLSVADVYNQFLPTPKTRSRKRAAFRYFLNSPLSSEYGTPATPATTPDPFATCMPPMQEQTPHPPATTPERVISVTRCPAADVNSVKVDIEVKVGRSPVGKLESQTVTYQLSALSQAYSAAVG